MDPYVYPETNVLKNLRDIRDLARLSKFETDMSQRRVAELEHQQIMQLMFKQVLALQQQLMLCWLRQEMRLH